jgi:hypothetical protein
VAIQPREKRMLIVSKMEIFLELALMVSETSCIDIRSWSLLGGSAESKNPIKK